MVHSGKDRLRELLDELIWFPSNDPLVDSTHHMVMPVEANFLDFPVPFEGVLKKIIHKANETQRENGSFPLCLAQGQVEWVINEKIVSTPIWLTPLTVARDRVKQTVSFKIDQEESFINPFIPLHLKRQFELDFPSHYSDAETCFNWLSSNGFDNVTTSVFAVGNFHHHRFSLVKELETILTLPDSLIVNQLLGEGYDQLAIEPFDVQPLFPLDKDQSSAITQASLSNLVIEGPPGTGKSHVLTTLLANVLANSKNALVVSEKRVALEVLKKKLGQFGLDQFAFIASSTTISRDFIQELKDGWQNLENRNSVSLTTQLRLSEQLFDQLQLQLDIVNTTGIAGGIDYAAFKALEPKQIDHIPYFSQLPDLAEWQRSEQLVREFYDRSVASSVGRIKRTLLSSPSFYKLDVLLRQWHDEWSNLNEQFGIRTWFDLQRAMKKAAVCHVFTQPSFKRFEALLLPESSGNKKLKRLKSSYLKALHTEEESRAKCVDWKKSPSEIECNFLIEIAASKRFWKKMQFKKAWSTFSRLPVKFASTAIENQLKWLAAKEALDAVQTKLYDLGISNPSTDLPEIEHLERAITSTDWSEWQQLTESEKQLFSDKNNRLHGLYSSLYSNLQLDDSTELEALFHHLLVHFPNLIAFREELIQLPDSLHRALLQFDSADSLFEAIYKRTVVQLNTQFPQLNQFSEQGMLEKSLKIHQLQGEEGELFAAHIQARQLKRFNAYSTLLTQSTTKLNSEEKELRKRLKNGKSILVKAFSKSRNLPTIRELLESDARFWIDVLKPLWLSNPTQVASNIPLESGCFSLTLIDEASQLPLSDAIGCLYRSRHVVIAGDSQQMGPSTFFRKGGEQIDLLHQASYYWPNVHLTHHYRSEDPRLIAFSNKYFYSDQLIAFPSAHTNLSPIELVYCPTGRYIDRTNKEEAKAVAKQIELALNDKKSIGIVAFSATQLAAIERELSVEAINQLEELIESGSGFFKPLEQVQGEECDELIVSIGYGKNEEGEFHMRFGPLNQVNGHKRLNVLFTRAKKSIVVHTSITSKDFKPSDNEAVQLLRNYLYMAEQHQQESASALLLPFGLKPAINGNTLKFKNLYQQIADANEMVTLLNVLKQRGWDIRLGME